MLKNPKNLLKISTLQNPKASDNSSEASKLSTNQSQTESTLKPANAILKQPKVVHTQKEKLKPSQQPSQTQPTNNSISQLQIKKVQLQKPVKKETYQQKEARIKNETAQLIYEQVQEEEKELRSLITNPSTSQDNTISIKIQDLAPITNQKRFSQIQKDKGYNNPVHSNEKLIFESKIADQLNDEFIQGPTGSPFFDSCFLAYILHGEWTISPDDVWFVISQQVSQYVNQNSELLRKLFVGFQGKKTLQIVLNENDPAFTDGIYSDKFRWDICTKLFSKLIHKNTKPEVANDLLANFSTTQLGFNKVISETSLMATLKKYFKYEMMLAGCGITTVHFKGVAEDWQILLDKVKQLHKYNLPRQWIDKVANILNKINQTVNNQVDVKFWNQIVEERKEDVEMPNLYDDGFYLEKKEFLTGWIFDLLMYDKEKNAIYNQNVQKLELNNVPNHFARAPVEITFFMSKFGDGKKDVNFCGGFTKIKKNQLNFSPCLQFMVAEKIGQKKKN